MGTQERVYHQIDAALGETDLITIKASLGGLDCSIQAWGVWATFRICTDAELQDALHSISAMVSHNCQLDYYRAALLTQLLRKCYYNGARSVRPNLAWSGFPPRGDRERL